MIDQKNNKPPTPAQPGGGEAISKLDALRQRESELRAKIAAEVKRQQKRHWRELDRLRTIVGGALIRLADQSPEYKLMLVQSIQSADLSPAERAFLKSQGWQ
jgi:hypothetical protein